MMIHRSLGATTRKYAAMIGILVTVGSARAGDTFEGRTAASWARDLVSERAVVRMEARRALQALGSKAVPALSEMLSPDDLREALLAAHALGTIGPKAEAALPRLDELYRDPSFPMWAKRGLHGAITRISGKRPEHPARASRPERPKREMPPRREAREKGGAR